VTYSYYENQRDALFLNFMK